MNRSGLLMGICLTAIVAASCSASSKKLDLGGTCVQNSDCNNPLACKFQACHTQCVQSRDCPTGQQCVAADDGSGVCQTQAEAACGAANGKVCASPLACISNACVNVCPSGICPLATQTCIGGRCQDTQVAGNDGAAGAGVGVACTLSSDCASSLLCKFGSCHQTCETSAGCANGGRCVTANGVAVCQIPAEAACGAGATCAAGLACRTVDNTCRSACTSSAGCLTGQTCAGTVCVDTTELAGNPGNDGAAGADGGADAPTTGIDAPASGVDAIATGGGGSTGSKVDGSPPTAGTSGTACTPGQAPTNFGNVATSDSNPNYTSGVGVLTATEFLIFNGYVGPDATDGGVVDGATATLVNRIDVQHFDPISGKKKGSATPLLTAAGDGGGLYVTGADIAPTGEIAIIYSLHATSGWGAYLAFLDKDLATKKTTQFVAWGSGNYCYGSSHVKWLNGEFVASSVATNGVRNLKLGKFGADGSNAGSTNALPTNDPSSVVAESYLGGLNGFGQGEVAFSGGLFAVSFYAEIPGNSNPQPYLTIVDTSGAGVGSPVRLPNSSADLNAARSVAAAGTSNGFVTVYNGTSTSKVDSLVATFVSNSASGDAGVPVGTTYAFPGGHAPQSLLTLGGATDGTGAGFAVLYPNGSVSFLYFGADGSPRGNPQTVLYQTNPTGDGDEVQVTNFGGTFAVSLYSTIEHSTQVVATTCQ